MAKGIARLGILLSSLLVSAGAGAVTVGGLLISEIMVNPAAVSDNRGEWFELYNPTLEEINLRDFILGDDRRDSHKIETDLLIMPGHFLTLGRNGDTSVNGGFNVDYVYDHFTLSNSGDEIVLREGPVERLRLEYGSDFDAPGQSRELIGSLMVEENYGLTFAGLTYGLGDIGTPGAPGSNSLAPSAVPLPATAWLFITGVLVMLKIIPAGGRVEHARAGAFTTKNQVTTSRSRIIPAESRVIAAETRVIPAEIRVIPAKAGILQIPAAALRTAVAQPEPAR